MAIKWDQHGGGCCGIRHIFEFYNKKDVVTKGRWSTATKTPDEMRTEIKAAITGCIQDMDGEGDCDCDWDEVGECDCSKEISVAIECVLAPQQIDPWEPLLLEAGFKEVFRFTNSNSDNELVVYMLNAKQEGAS